METNTRRTVEVKKISLFTFALLCGLYNPLAQADDLPQQTQPTNQSTSQPQQQINQELKQDQQQIKQDLKNNNNNNETDTQMNYKTDQAEEKSGPNSQ